MVILNVWIEGHNFSDSAISSLYLLLIKEYFIALCLNFAFCKIE